MSLLQHLQATEGDHSSLCNVRALAVSTLELVVTDSVKGSESEVHDE